MPRIRTYTSEGHGADAAAGATAGAAFGVGQDVRRGLSSIAQGLGDVGHGFEVAHDHDVQQEHAKASIALSNFATERDQAWDEALRTADPTDTGLADWFHQDTDQKLASLQSSLGLETTEAQRTFDVAAADFKHGMFVKAAGDQSRLAGIASTSALLTTGSQTAELARRNPAGLDDYLKLQHTLVAGQIGAHGLSTEAALPLMQKLDEQTAHAAFQGMAEKDPAAALAALQAGTFDKYTEGRGESWQREAEAVQRSQTHQAAADEVARVKANKAAANQAATQITASTIDAQGNVHLPQDYYKNIQQLAQMPDVDPSLPRSMMAAGRAITSAEQKGQAATSDPETYAGFQLRMAGQPEAPDALSQQEIFQARAEGRLSDKDMGFFLRWQKTLESDPRARAQHQAFTTFLKGYKAFITKSNMIAPDAIGDQRFYQFSVDKWSQYQAAIASGKSPDDLLDPKSRDFIGRDIQRYQTTLQQGTAAITQQATGGVAPLPPVPAAAARQPNESIAAYLKRTGG